MEKTRVAIVGGGWFGQFHLDNLLLMDDVEVAAFATGNAARLAALAAKAPTAHTYPDHESMFDKEVKLDAVIACVPPDSHHGIEHLAAQKRINLFMEKPLGVDLAEVLRCQKSIQESGIVCAVGYQTRYNPHLDAIRDAIRDNDDEIGTVVAKWMGIMPETPWWRVKQRSGGQFAEQVTHVVDVLRYLFGDVRSVYSAARRGLITGVPNYDVEDASITALVFESGLLATVTTGCFVNPAEGVSEIKIEMYGKKNHFTYQWDTQASRENKKHLEVRRFGNDFHFPALRTFIEAVQSGDTSKIRSSYPDAVKTFKTTWAANLSVESGKEVSLSTLPAMT